MRPIERVFEGWGGLDSVLRLVLRMTIEHVGVFLVLRWILFEMVPMRWWVRGVLQRLGQVD